MTRVQTSSPSSSISPRQRFFRLARETPCMGQAEGFEWSTRKNGDVVITHHGRAATTLRGRRAVEFLDEVDEVDGSDEQELMARLTGNYKRGNEREARRHPRNRG